MIIVYINNNGIVLAGVIILTYLRIFFSSHSDAKGSIREIILPKGLDLDRPKRTRTSFTAEQLYRLEMEFQRCQYVVGRERTELARQLNLSETQVRTNPQIISVAHNSQ